MKKIITLLSLLIAISAPKPSCSQNKTILLEICDRQKKIYDTQEKIYDNSQTLYDIYDDLAPILDNRGEVCERQLSRLIIRSSAVICHYTTHLLSTLRYITEEGKIFWYNDYKGVISNSKGSLQQNLDTLRIMYGVLENKAALLLIDKAKDNIRSSIKLYDQVIELLQQYGEQTEGKQKRKE